MFGADKTCKVNIELLVFDKNKAERLQSGMTDIDKTNRCRAYIGYVGTRGAMGQVPVHQLALKSTHERTTLIILHTTKLTLTLTQVRKKYYKLRTKKEEPIDRKIEI